MDYPWVQVSDGVRRRVWVVGKGMMQVVVEIGPGRVTAEHSHPHEQLIHVLEGEVLVSIEGAERTYKAGDSIAIPPGVVHGARTPQNIGTRLLDTFTPLREDFL